MYVVAEPVYYSQLEIRIHMIRVSVLGSLYQRSLAHDLAQSLQTNFSVIVFVYHVILTVLVLVL